MSEYEVRPCEGLSHGKWCIFVNEACDHSLGEFSSKPEADAKVCQLLLQKQILAKDSAARFEISDPAKKDTFYGPIVAVIEASEGFGCGIAQSRGRGIYVLHTGKAFAEVAADSTSVTIEYLDGEIKVELPNSNEKDGKGR